VIMKMEGRLVRLALVLDGRVLGQSITGARRQLRQHVSHMSAQRVAGSCGMLDGAQVCPGRERGVPTSRHLFDTGYPESRYWRWCERLVSFGGERAATVAMHSATITCTPLDRWRRPYLTVMLGWGRGVQRTDIRRGDSTSSWYWTSTCGFVGVLRGIKMNVTAKGPAVEQRQDTDDDLPMVTYIRMVCISRPPSVSQQVPVRRDRALLHAARI
jgi:hypothetical protein